MVRTIDQTAFTRTYKLQKADVLSKGSNATGERKDEDEDPENDEQYREIEDEIEDLEVLLSVVFVAFVGLGSRQREPVLFEERPRADGSKRYSSDLKGEASILAIIIIIVNYSVNKKDG